jgi:small subunit ribosomal protein S24e
LIYDDLDSLLSIEPRYRLVRKGLAKAREGSRKQRKERKNRALRARGKVSDKSTVHRSGSRLDRLFITVPSWIRGL